MALCLSSLSIVFFLAGCGKDEPQYVEVQAMEEEVPAMQDNPGDHAESMAKEPLTYTLPEGWTLVPARPMQMLTIQAGESTSVPATVSVSAFPGDVGGKVANINRWRGQIGLGPVSAEVAEESITSTTVAGYEGWRVDLTGPAPTDSHSAARLVVAAIPYAGQTWFFKLVGAEGSVEKELEHFQAFLDSVSF